VLPRLRPLEPEAFMLEAEGHLVHSVLSPAACLYLSGSRANCDDMYCWNYWA
jgi:hypothetical protein